MRRHSRFTILGLVSVFFFMSAALAHAQQPLHEIDLSKIDISNVPLCLSTAPARYPKGPTIPNVRKDRGACYEEIDRYAEVAPPPLTLFGGTRVFVRVKNPRPNETLQALVTFTHIPPPDLGTDILKNATNPLQTITLSPAVSGYKAALLKPDPCDVLDAKFHPYDCQEWISAKLNTVQNSINMANSALSCLENYQIATPYPAQLAPPPPPPPIQKYTCTASTPINPSAAVAAPDSFAAQKKLVQDVVDTAAHAPIPNYRLSQLDAYLTSHATSDMKKCKAAGTCAMLADSYDIYQSNEASLKAGVSAIQSAQSTLQQTLLLLRQVPNTADTKGYYVDVPPLTTATVTITGVEILSKTNSTISTWTSSPTSHYFVLSTGLGFSNLIYRTYANTPEVQNGAPVLNSAGNGISVVTKSETRLTVLAPEVVGSVLIPKLNRLETKCSFGCSLLVSGGIGANLTMKSADFDTGLSVRLSNFLVTPAVHFGRDTRLMNGITVGSQLGAGAPNTLPTENKWVRKFGIVFTYVIPLT